MKFQKYSRTPLQVHFKAAGSDAIDLLEKMLTYDPNKRINTREVTRTYRNLTYMYYKYLLTIIINLQVNNLSNITFICLLIFDTLFIIKLAI